MWLFVSLQLKEARASLDPLLATTKMTMKMKRRRGDLWWSSPPWPAPPSATPPAPPLTPRPTQIRTAAQRRMKRTMRTGSCVWTPVPWRRAGSSPPRHVSPAAAASPSFWRPALWRTSWSNTPACPSTPTAAPLDWLSTLCHDPSTWSWVCCLKTCPAPRQPPVGRRRRGARWTTLVTGNIPRAGAEIKLLPNLILCNNHIISHNYDTEA